MYTVWLANFNTVVYEGSDKVAAMAAAFRTGLDCSMSTENRLMTWNPFSGWRYIY